MGRLNNPVCPSRWQAARRRRWGSLSFSTQALAWSAVLADEWNAPPLCTQAGPFACTPEMWAVSALRASPCIAVTRSKRTVVVRAQSVDQKASQAGSGAATAEQAGRQPSPAVNVIQPISRWVPPGRHVLHGGRRRRRRQKGGACGRLRPAPRVGAGRRQQGDCVL